MHAICKAEISVRIPLSSAIYFRRWWKGILSTHKTHLYRFSARVNQCRTWQIGVRKEDQEWIPVWSNDASSCPKLSDVHTSCPRMLRIFCYPHGRLCSHPPFLAHYYIHTNVNTSKNIKRQRGNFSRFFFFFFEKQQLFLERSWRCVGGVTPRIKN